MTTSDEEHLKKLKEGQLNFQRVAFEQRLRRGETLAKKKESVDTGDGEVNSQNDDKNMTSVCNEVQSSTKNIEYLRDMKTLTVEQESVSEIQRVSSESEDREENSTYPDTCATTPVQQPSMKKKVQFERKPLSGKNKKSFLHQTFSKPSKKFGVFARSLSSKTNSFCCSYSVLDEGEEIKSYNPRTSSTVKRKIFLYGNEGARKRQKTSSDQLDFFKNTKLHASRTSLMMHRSLTNEKLLPTNAMNTHDALVMNPMEITFHLKTSPFRDFFNQCKHKLTSSEEGIWKRFRECPDVSNHIGGGLPVDDYCSILKEEFEFNAVYITYHTLIVERIKAVGVAGLKIKLFNVSSVQLITNCF